MIEEKKHVEVKLNNGQILRIQMTHAECERFLYTIKDHKELFAYSDTIIIRKSEIVYALVREAT